MKASFYQSFKFSCFSTLVIVISSILIAKTLVYGVASETEFAVVDGSMEMEIQSVHGNSYFYQHSTDLENWKYLPHIQYGTGSILQQSLTDPLGAKNFYRVKDTSIPTVDPKNDDFDGDGISNFDEVREGGTGTDPFVADSDGDGKSDYESDTNNDGFSDGWALDSFGDVDFDQDADPDGDGINNGQEAIDNSNPNVSADIDDTDEDGLTNEEEVELGTDPFDNDTDADGLTDGVDADPLDKAVAWEKVPEQQYAVVDIGLPETVELDEAGWKVDLGEGNHVLLSRDNTDEWFNSDPEASFGPNGAPPKTYFKTYVWENSIWSENLELPDNLRGAGSSVDTLGNVYTIGMGALGVDESWPGSKITYIAWKKETDIEGWGAAIAELSTPGDNFSNLEGTHAHLPGIIDFLGNPNQFLYGETGHLVVEVNTDDQEVRDASVQRIAPTIAGPILQVDPGQGPIYETRLAGDPSGWHAVTWSGENENGPFKDYSFSKLTEQNTLTEGTPPEGDTRWSLTSIASIDDAFKPDGVSEIVIWQNTTDGFQVGTQGADAGDFSWQASTKIDSTKKIGGIINSRGEGLQPSSLWRNGAWTDINALTADDSWEITRAEDINNNGVILAKAKRLKNEDGTPIASGDQVTTLVLLAAIDIVVDSDNDNGSDLPTGGADEVIAGGEFTDSDDLIKYPGKILYSQNGDIDRDGVPDFADGFSDGDYTTANSGIGRDGLTASQLDGATGAPEESDTPQTAKMVPIVLRMPQGMTSNIAVHISYTGSDPKSIKKKEKDGRYYYMLPEVEGGEDEGFLRLWTKNREVEDCSVMDFSAEADAADSGDYIPNDIVLGKEAFDKLNYDSAQGGYVLWVESVATSKEIRDQSIDVEIYRIKPDGSNGLEFINKTVYFSSINMNLVQLHKDGSGEAASGEIKMSHTSPVIEAEVNVTKPRWGVIKDLTAQSAGGYGWVVDITVKGSILSPLLDTLTPEQGGTIEKAFLYANGVEDHIREINVGVTKGYTPDNILAPFPYKGTINQTFTGVEAIDGINILEVRTADKVYKLDGYHQSSFTLTLPENPPEDYESADPSQPDPESLALHERGYVLKPHLDPTNPDQPLSEVDTYTLSAEGNILLTDLIIHRSTDPLEPDEFRDADNRVHLKITPYETRSTPRVSNHPTEYFRSDSLHIVLYDGFIMNGNAVFCTYCPPPLDDDGNPTTAADGYDEYCGLITTFSASGQEIQLTGAETIDQSDGGEFHPYVWEMAGPLDLIESMQGLQVSDMSRTSVDVDVPGGSRKVEFEADITTVKMEIAEEARRDQEERDRATLANSLSPDALGIVSFKPAEQEMQKTISDEFFAAVNRVKALELYPESELDFAKGVGVGVAKGGVEMVGGLKDAVVMVGKVIYEGGKAIIRGVGFALRVVWKLSTGQSLEQERRQAAEIAAKARKAKEWVVKKYQFFKELMDEGKDVLLLVLSGDFRKLDRLSGHLRMMISFSIELFAGLLEKYAGKSSYEKGIFVGRAIFEVGSLFIGIGIIAKAGQAVARVSKAKFLTKLAERSPAFKTGFGADVMQNVKNSVGKGLGIVDNTVVVSKSTRMCFIAGTLIATAQADDGSPALASATSHQGTQHSTQAHNPRSVSFRAFRGSEKAKHQAVTHKPIEQIRKGDIVWSKNDKTGEIGKNRVLQTFITHPNTLYHLKLDHDNDGIADETVSGTYQHPFWEAEQKKWVEMGTLKAGQQLELLNGKSTYIIANHRERAPPRKTFVTYNFEVEHDHTYFVGRYGIWVHNEGNSACERVFSLYHKLRTRSLNPGDPVAAYEETKKRMNKLTKWDQDLKSTTVDGVIDDIAKLKAEGKLDLKSIELGTDPANGFKSREVFVGRRFEIQTNKTLTRSSVVDEEYIDELGQAWDAFGPIPSKFYNWNNVKNSIDAHFNKQGIKNVFDLAGLSPTQKKQMKDYITSKSEWIDQYVLLED